MYRLAKSGIINFCKILFGNAASEPLFPLYHITPFCNLKCSYCDGLLEKNNQNISQLDTAGVISVLEILRRRFDYIFFTGGEPFIRSDIDEILNYARKLKFRRIAINTNSLMLPEKEKCLESVDQLSISLDSLDGEMYDKILGVDGAAEKIVENVLRYAQFQTTFRYVLTVHCVIIPGRISHARNVLQFCTRNNIKICLSPLVVDYAPHRELMHNSEYQELIKTVINLKKKSRIISGTFLFYRSILNCEPYTCQPFLVPRIFPMGELLYPCRPIGEKGQRVSLLKAGSWENAVRVAERSFSPVTKCNRSCRIRCYIEPSLITRHPWHILSEYIFNTG